MSTRPHRIPVVPLDWVLIANAARARCFERDGVHDAMREVADFVHPASRLKGEALDDERGGKVHKGVASTRFDPHTDAHVKEHDQFARELGRFLESAALEHRMPGLSVFASNPFMGVLRSHLGEATLRLLKASVVLDLTTYSGADLEGRVSRALPPATPDAS